MGRCCAERASRRRRWRNRSAASASAASAASALSHTVVGVAVAGRVAADERGPVGPAAASQPAPPGLASASGESRNSPLLHAVTSSYGADHIEPRAAGAGGGQCCGGLQSGVGWRGQHCPALPRHARRVGSPSGCCNGAGRVPVRAALSCCAVRVGSPSCLLRGSRFAPFARDGAAVRGSRSASTRCGGLPPGGALAKFHPWLEVLEACWKGWCGDDDSAIARRDLINRARHRVSDKTM